MPFKATEVEGSISKLGMTNQYAKKKALGEVIRGTPVCAEAMLVNCGPSASVLQ